jgi:predicted HTH domain antitoxin
MSQFNITLPDSISEAEARVCLAAKLFELGRLSCGKAAELAGYSKRTFIELLGDQGVAVLDYPVDELTDDFAHA